MIFADRKELIDIFTEHTTSDIDSAPEMLQVLKLFIEARDAPLREVKFEGTLGPSFSRRRPPRSTGRHAVPRARGQPRGTWVDLGPRGPRSRRRAEWRLTRLPATAAGVEEGQGGGRRRGGALEHRGDRVRKGARQGHPLPQDQAARLLPDQAREGTDYAQKPRVYKINGTGKGSPPNQSALPTSGSSRARSSASTTASWRRGGRSPRSSRTLQREGDRGPDRQLYYDGDRLRTSAGRSDEGSFWLSNTLVQSLSDREMLKIAKGMTELPPRGRLSQPHADRGSA